jgi:hypothetical protein
VNCTGQHARQPSRQWLARTPAGFLLAFCLLVTGCGAKKPATSFPSVLSNPKEGYVYLAELLSAHPLYEEARSLGEEIAQLQSGSRPGFLWPAPWSVPLLSGGLGPFPEAALRGEAHNWRAGLETAVAVLPPGLPADLETSRQWRYLQIDAKRAHKLAALESAESARLATQREELVRSRLTELTNVGLDLSLPAPQRREEADRKQAAIWAEIEAEMAAETTASKAEVAAEGKALAVEAAAEKAKIEAEILAEAEARRRQAQTSPALQDLREDMNKAVEGLVAQDGVGERTKQLAGIPPPAGMRESGAQAQAQVLAQYEATRRLQIERLRAGQAALMLAILADTRRAVLKVAFEDNLRLHLIPTASPVGANLTAEVGERVRAIWTGEPGLEAVGAQENAN